MAETRKSKVKALPAPPPREDGTAVRAAVAHWLERMRSTFNDLYDVSYAIAAELKDNPDGEIARCLSLGADEMFHIAANIADIDSTLNATYLLPHNPMPNPLRPLRG